MAPGTRCLPVGRYPPVAVRVLVGDRAAPGVVHPAGAPAAAAAPAAATAAGHLVAQVRTGLGAGHAAQRIDPRVGASVAAHVGGHSESRSAPRHKRGRAGSEKVEGFKGKAPNREPGRARRWVAGTLLATRAVPAAASAARRAEVGRGDDVGRGAGAAGRVRLGGRRGRRGAGSRLGVGVGRRGRESPPRWHPAPRPHLAGFFPGRGAAAAPPRPPRVSPTRSGRPSPPAPAGPRLRPAPLRPEERRQGRGPRDPSAPGAATEGRAFAGGGRRLSASAATAGKARPLLFRISSVPGAEISRKIRAFRLDGYLLNIYFC